MTLASRRPAIDNGAMHIRQTCKVIAALAVFPWLGACASTAPNATRFSVVHLSGADRSAVLFAAEEVLLDSGFTIDLRDTQAGILTTQPVFQSDRTGIAGRRRQLSSRQATRHVARVQVVQPSGVIDVYCRVVVQQRSTGAHRYFGDEYRDSDTPNATPIDRDAATTPQQNAVWTTTRRARSDERRILDEIAHRVGDPAMPSAGG